MFTKIIIGFIALAGIILYDVLHQKPALTQLRSFFESGWIKYTVAFVVATFGYSFLTETRFWQYIQLAGAVVLIWWFWGVIAGLFTSVKGWFK